MRLVPRVSWSGVPTAPPSSGRGVPLYSVFFSRAWNFLCLLGQGQGGGRQGPEEAPGTCQSRRERQTAWVALTRQLLSLPLPWGQQPGDPRALKSREAGAQRPALLEAPRESGPYLSLCSAPGAASKPWPPSACGRLIRALPPASQGLSLSLSVPLTDSPVSRRGTSHWTRAHKSRETES